MFNRKIIKYLNTWKDRKGRKPLIIRGARQVGKTVSIKMFAGESFPDMVYLNLEDPEQERLFRNPLSLEDFEKIVQLKFGKTLKEGTTLLFIDEIQNSPALIKLLRFFYEEKPLLHVIAAGSLMEVRMKKEGFSFPVGRVEYAYLHPLDFFEFLEAIGEKETLSYLSNFSPDTAIPGPIHDMSSKLFGEYLMVGGMPEAVKAYVEEKNLSLLPHIYNSLFTSYLEDIPKYAAEASAKYLVHIIENAPLFAGQTITYENFAGSGFKSREISSAFDTLEKAMLVYRAAASNSVALPLTPKIKKAPKLIFLDAGLVNYRLGIRDVLLGKIELNEFFRGKIAEQVTGQQLLALEENRTPSLSYWYRDVPGSTAEVDFVLPFSGSILAIEVKSGKSGHLKSLREFAKLTGIKKLFRVYNGLFAKEEVSTKEISFTLVSIPFYLLPQIKNLAEQI
ncbi:MAG: AAA family ATPase [Candidatus Saganbacteria bacterium]|nr:AAA family ATPase [Candidatus Saganbacteria bacterium]